MHTIGDLAYTAFTEAAGGAVAGVIADSVLYGVDSAKIHQQQAATATTTRPRASPMLLYRGLVPTVLLGSVPVFGVFFLLYAPMRDVLTDAGHREWLPVASALCAVPATVVGVPADVLKKRIILKSPPTPMQGAIRDIIETHGWKGFFAGWHVNLIRDLPFAGVKIGLYEIMVKYYQDYYQISQISPAGASLCGIGSGVACAIATCPLDVINTQIKAQHSSKTTKYSYSIWTVGRNIVQQQGITALFRGVGMRSIVLGIGGMIFWPIQQGVAQSLGSDKFSFQDMWMEIYH